MNFYTLFTRTENVHLMKDVGMIPEKLAQNYPNVNSFLVTLDTLALMLPLFLIDA